MIPAGTKVTPELARRIAAEFEMKIIKKEIETLEEWIGLINDIFKSTTKKGATVDALIEAYRLVTKNMEARKKICFREISEAKKKY